MDKTRLLLLAHHADRAGLAPCGRLAASPAQRSFPLTACATIHGAWDVSEDISKWNFITSCLFAKDDESQKDCKYSITKMVFYD